MSKTLGTLTVCHRRLNAKADKMFLIFFSGQKVDVVEEVDLTSDKAKNDMIQV